jgi:hypothetical protein
LYRAKLTVARDVYGRHPAELDDLQTAALLELIALAVVEAEEIDGGHR